MQFKNGQNDTAVKYLHKISYKMMKYKNKAKVIESLLL